MSNWQIIQGDCLDVMRGMADNSVDAVITDPPYGIDYQSARRTDKAQWKPKIANDKEPFTVFIDDAARCLKNGGAFYCFCRYDVMHSFIEAMDAAGLQIRSEIIWDKVSHGMGDLHGAWASQHETILFASKGRHILNSPRPKSIIRAQRLAGTSMLHPNEKPVDLFRPIIKASTSEGNIILDPFCGVGPLGVAATELGRKYIGIELNPEYAEMSRKRLENTVPLFAGQGQ